MFVSIGETAVLLGVAIITLRRWDKAGVFCPSWRSPGFNRVLRAKILFPFKRSKKYYLSQKTAAGVH